MKRYSVYSLISTEMFTQSSSPSRPVRTETISIPPENIPEQLDIAYSAQALSTAALHLGRLRQYGINCLAQGQTKVSMGLFHESWIIS